MRRSYCFFLLPILVASAGCPSTDNNVGSLGKDSGVADADTTASTCPTNEPALDGVCQGAVNCTYSYDCINPCRPGCVPIGPAPSGVSRYWSCQDGRWTTNSDLTVRCLSYMEDCQCPAVSPDAGVPDAGPGGSGLGGSCSVLAGAAAWQAVYNNQALECASRICLKPMDEFFGGVDTGPFCTSGCSTDSDCVGETRDPNDPSDKRCAGGYACTVQFVVGPLVCKKLCSCKDFLKKPPVIPTSCSSTPAADIYAVLLGDTGGKSVIIKEQTATDHDGVANTAQTVASATSRMTGVDPATTSSFLAQNATAQSLGVDDIPPGMSYDLLSPTDPIWNDPNFWTTLRTRYPNALVIPQGVVGYEIFSRVGFNANMDQALVYMGTYAQMIAGTYVSFLEQGYYYLMKKVNGFWTIDQKVLIWTS